VPGFLVDIQSRFLDQLSTRVVIPLVPLDLAPKATLPSLNPVFVIGGDSYMLVTQALVALPVKRLRAPVGTLEPHRDEIVRAVDALLSGL